MHKTLLALTMAAAFATPALADDVKVINPDAWFAEGPIWYQDKLFYVEYGRETVLVFDRRSDLGQRHLGCGVLKAAQ